MKDRQSVARCCCSFDADPPFLIIEQNGYVKYDKSIVAGRNDFYWLGWQYLRGGGENYAYPTSDGRVTFLTLEETSPGNWNCGYYVISYPSSTDFTDLDGLIGGSGTVHFSQVKTFALTTAGLLDQEAQLDFNVNGASPVKVSIRGFTKNNLRILTDSTGALTTSVLKRYPVGTYSDIVPKTREKIDWGSSSKTLRNTLYHNGTAPPRLTTAPAPAGRFFFMYSANIIQNRFPSPAIPSGNTHMILVNYVLGFPSTWAYLTTDDTFVPFTPAANDYVISEVNPITRAVITSYRDDFFVLDGMNFGYQYGNDVGTVGAYQFFDSLPAGIPPNTLADWHWENENSENSTQPAVLSDADVVDLGRFDVSRVSAGDPPDFSIPITGAEPIDYARPLIGSGGGVGADGGFADTFHWASGPFDNDFGWPFKAIDMTVNGDVLPTQIGYNPLDGLWIGQPMDNPAAYVEFLTGAEFNEPENHNPVNLPAYGVDVPIVLRNQTARFTYSTAAQEVSWTAHSLYIYTLIQNNVDINGTLYDITWYADVRGTASGVIATGIDFDFTAQLTSNSGSSTVTWSIATAVTTEEVGGGTSLPTGAETAYFADILEAILLPLNGTAVNVTMSLAGVNTP